MSFHLGAQSEKDATPATPAIPYLLLTARPSVHYRARCTAPSTTRMTRAPIKA
jgi:hypothetical protein